jgi:eukaryotic-like serine/threonine-protein kinase
MHERGSGLRPHGPTRGQRRRRSPPRGDQISVGNVSGTDAVAVGAGAHATKTVITNVFSTADAAQDLRNRRVLVEEVKLIWVEGVLRRAQRDSTVVALQKRTQNAAVSHPWSDLGIVDNDREVPPHSSILSVFADAQRALLILGAPGSGKTLTLLELARLTIERAEADPNEPVPVVLHLSSWARRRQSLSTWIVDELNSKYFVPRKIGQGWLGAQSLLLLLDGLDEVDRDDRVACVRAINAFRALYGLTGIAVCSRTEEFTDLSVQANLGGAIVLCPLTNAQIDDVLDSAGPAANSLRTAVRTDPAMHHLAESPLLLNIMASVYRENPPAAADRYSSADDQMRQLFGAAVGLAYKHRSKQLRYGTARSIAVLAWVASRMEAHNQSIFLLEQLQPTWLSSPLQKWAYAMGSRLAVGCLLGLGLVLFSLDPGTLVVGLAGGLAFGAIRGVQLTSPRAGRGAASSRLGRLLTFGTIALTTAAAVGVVALLVGAGLAAIFYALFLACVFCIRAYRWRADEDVGQVEALGWSWRAARRGVPLGVLCSALITPFFFFADSEISFDDIFASGFPVIITNIQEHTVNALIHAAIAVLIVLFLVLIYGLQARSILTSKRLNQATYNSLRSALFVSSLLVVICGGFVTLVYVVSTALTTDYDMPMILLEGAKGWIRFAPVIALPAAAWYGGLAVIQHFVLRLVLGNGEFPIDCAPVLDDAADRRLLQRVGGGYMFSHRLLLDYFRSLNS